MENSIFFNPQMHLKVNINSTEYYLRVVVQNYSGILYLRHKKRLKMFEDLFNVILCYVMLKN